MRTGPAMLLVPTLVLVGGCVTSTRNMQSEPPAHAVPDYSRLRARIDAYGAALTSGDDETAYAIHTPSIRAGFSLDEFKREREDLRRAGPVQIIFHAVTPCVCGEFSYPRDVVPTERALRCVLLIDASSRQGTEIERRSKFLMTWEHIAGDWYYLIVLEGDACPAK